MEFRRLFEILAYQATHYPQKVAIGQFHHQVIDTCSTEKCLEQIQQLSAGLLDLGFSPKNKVAILAGPGSPPWLICDLALQQTGIITVPIHHLSSNEELHFILSETACVAVFAIDEATCEKVAGLKEDLPALQFIYCFEEGTAFPYWKNIMAAPLDRHLERFETFKAAIHEDDVATIIYTSGVTGVPKGVMLSHKNIVSNIKAVIDLIPITCDKVTISFLPLTHIFERMAVYTYMAIGASVIFVPSLEDLDKAFRQVRPHYFTAVPRIIERMYDQIRQRMRELPFFKKRMLKWALALGMKYETKKISSPLYYLKLQIADLFVYQPWRKQLGGRVSGIVVGAAAFRPELARLFSAAGIDIREGYGLTETSPVVAMNRFPRGGYKFGTVGMPLPEVTVKIDELNESQEGEILVKGPNVMKGYYNNALLTAQTITPDGWLHTGDIGRWVDDKYLKITGRKKLLFKTAAGKYVSPVQLESILQDSSYIDMAMVIGGNRPHVTALILPNFSNLKQWADLQQIHWTAPRYMVVNLRIKQFFEGILDNFNIKLHNHERIRGFILIPDEWSVFSGEFTPTMKLRRQWVLDKYAKQITKMYDS